MTTLADATLDLARVITSVLESVATGGSATTVVDAGGALAAPDQPVDYWTKGTIWMLSGLNDGKSRYISGWDAVNTFTFPTMTALNAAGDLYAVAPQDWPLWVLRQCVNKALQDFGDLPQTDISLTTVANQEKYDLPAGAEAPYKVEIAYQTASPYEYYPHLNWRIYNSDLLFDTDHEPTDTGYIIRLWYEAAHAWLTADTDIVSPYCHPERLKWEAAVYAWRWKLQQRGGDSPLARDMLNEAVTNRQLQRSRHPVLVDINPDPKYARW